MRAMLCCSADIDYPDVSTVTGPGIGKIGQEPGQVLFHAISDWTSEDGRINQFTLDC